MFKKILGIIFVLLFIIVLKPEKSVAISPTGQGVFVVNSCSTISSPISGQTWCILASSSPPTIYEYFNGVYVIALNLSNYTGPVNITANSSNGSDNITGANGILQGTQNVMAWGAGGSTNVYTAASVSGSTVNVSGTDFKVGEGISIPNSGNPCAITGCSSIPTAPTMAVQNGQNAPGISGNTKACYLVAGVDGIGATTPSTATNNCITNAPALTNGVTPPDWATGSDTQYKFILPTSNNAGGYIYAATTGGANSGTRPTFNQSVGSTTSDGAVVWTNEGLPWSASDEVTITTAAKAINQKGWLYYRCVSPINGSAPDCTQPSNYIRLAISIGNTALTIIDAGQDTAINNQFFPVNPPVSQTTEAFINTVAAVSPTTITLASPILSTPGTNIPIFHDDTVAINGAINAGSNKVYFPSTTMGYPISSLISIPANVELQGASNTASTLVRADFFINQVFNFGGGDTVLDLGWTSRDSGGAGHFGANTDVVFGGNSTFRNSFNRFYCHGDSGQCIGNGDHQLTVTNSKFIDDRWRTPIFDNCNSATVENTLGNITISNNIFNDVGDNAINTEDCDWEVINGNTIINNSPNKVQQDSIQIVGGSHHVITGNNLYTNSGFVVTMGEGGLRTSDSDINITGNTLNTQSPTDNPILIGNGTNITDINITGNLIYGPTAAPWGTMPQSFSARSNLYNGIPYGESTLYLTLGATPTLTAGCNGSGSSVTGNDNHGTITTQTAASTSCTLAFALTRPATPTCIFTDANGSATPLPFSTGATSTLSAIVDFASSASEKINYVCF